MFNKLLLSELGEGGALHFLSTYGLSGLVLNIILPNPHSTREQIPLSPPFAYAKSLGEVIYLWKRPSQSLI